MTPHEPTGNPPAGAYSTPLSDEQRQWIESTLLDLREGHGSVSDVATLRTLLSTNQEARRVYLRFNQLDCQLGSALPGAGVAQDTENNVTSVNFLQKLRPTHLVSALAGAGIAAVVTLMFTADKPAPEPNTAEQLKEPARPVASLYSDYGAQFNGGDAVHDQAFDKGALSLDRGIAQLAFRNGAQVVLEGKCGFEIIDEMTVVLNHGKMWASCPPEAHGFKVLTPSGREIIDLGTEFGVEVTPEGKSNVHVFDGLVKVVGPKSGAKEITAGHAIQWDQGSSSNQSKLADYDKFVTSTDLIQTRLRAHRDQMLKRDDLLLYYDFSKIKKGQLLNGAPNAPESSHGKIVKANKVSGRLGLSTALQFERPGSCVQLQLQRPASVKQFTTAIWVKIDQLPTSISTLINSNDWKKGGIHFQVDRNGSLKTGLHGSLATISPSRSIQLGQWHLLAATWDLETQRSQLYCDGKQLRSIRNPNGTTSSKAVDFQWGNCQIGSWKASPELKTDARDLKGRIDEVMIFNRSLSSQEIEELYMIGKP